MRKNIKIYDKWSGYTLADCECIYCLHYIENKGCTCSICCCLEEKAEAIEREKSACPSSKYNQIETIETLVVSA